MASITAVGKRLQIETTKYSASILTEGYVSGVAEGSFVDRKTGSRDPGFGLLIADFLLASGPATASGTPDTTYPVHDAYHGDIIKHYVSLPQICTQARTLPHEIVEGEGFVAVRQSYVWNIACPPHKPGSLWEQTLLFPDDKRWLISWDRFRCADRLEAPVLRLDMPGHIRHHGGDVFKKVYLSYVGEIPQHEFHQNFPPDRKYLYRRQTGKIPRRFIRGYQLENGTWLAGMALDPKSVAEAWCHQRDYVCFIEEIGGKLVRNREWQGAVHLVGYFDSVAEMEQVFDEHRGATGIRISTSGWDFTP